MGDVGGFKKKDLKNFFTAFVAVASTYCKPICCLSVGGCLHVGINTRGWLDEKWGGGSSRAFCGSQPAPLELAKTSPPLWGR